MATNATNPSTPAATLPTSDDKAAFEAAKKDLKQALDKKREADRRLVSPDPFPVVTTHNLIQAEVEVQLYQLEATYLTETTTNSGGNIITGFENYLKNQGIGRRKFEVTDHERMFSASSTTYQRVRITQDVFYTSALAFCHQSLELMGEGEESAVTQDDSKPTVAIQPTIKQRDETAATLKKIRDREYQRAKRAEKKKRSTIASDDESVTSAAGRKPIKRARTSVMNDDD